MFFNSLSKPWLASWQFSNWLLKEAASDCNLVKLASWALQAERSFSNCLMTSTYWALSLRQAYLSATHFFKSSAALPMEEIWAYKEVIWDLRVEFSVWAVCKMALT